MRLHQAHLLQAVEERDWDRFGRFFAAHYSDAWGHDKGFVLRESREVFRQFLLLTVQHEVQTLQVGEGRGAVSARITLEGSGSPIAQIAKRTVNGLREPFTFRWEQQSWKPWDWRLVAVAHPDLDLPEF